MIALRNTTDEILDVLYAASETLDFMALMIEPDQISDEDYNADIIIRYAIAQIHRHGGYAEALDYLSKRDLALKRNGQLWNKYDAACDVLTHTKMPHTNERDALDRARHTLPKKVFRR